MLILKYLGTIGHKFVVIKESTHWSAVDGWSTVGQFTDLETAKRFQASVPPTVESRIYERIGEKWHRIMGQ